MRCVSALTSIGEHDPFDGRIVNDALAVALAADPSLAKWEEMRVDVSLSDDARRGAARRTPHGGRTSVAMSVHANQVLAILEERVFSRWLSEGSFAQGAAEVDKWLGGWRRRITGSRLVRHK